MQAEQDVAQETYRLARDNNRILRTMRRNAFIAGVFKLIFWAVLILAPVWLYAHYLAPLVGGLQKELNAAQRSGGQVQSQFSDLQNLLKQFQASLPAATSTNR